MTGSQPLAPRDTRVEMTQIVLPQFTNALGTVFGGQIAAWMDVCAAVSAQRYSHSDVVTASFDELHFLVSVKQGMIVILKSQVNMAWRTSMEIGVRIDAEAPITGARQHCCSAYLTFVAVGAEGEPRPVPVFDPGVDPVSQRRAREAQLRRDNRLTMRAARLSAGDGS